MAQTLLNKETPPNEMAGKAMFYGLEITDKMYRELMLLDWNGWTTFALPNGKTAAEHVTAYQKAKEDVEKAAPTKPAAKKGKE